jgi:hypothetical protein
LELLKMLLGKPLVGGDEENGIELSPFVSPANQCLGMSPPLQIVDDLPEVHMEEQGLTRACRHEKGESPEVLRSERGNLPDADLLFSRMSEIRIEFQDKLLRIVREPIQINLGIEETQILKVLE